MPKTLLRTLFSINFKNPYFVIYAASFSDSTFKTKRLCSSFSSYIQSSVSGKEKAQGPAGPDTTSYYVKHRPVRSEGGETESAKKRPNRTSDAESPNQTSSGQRALLCLSSSGRKWLYRARYPNTLPAH